MRSARQMTTIQCLESKSWTPQVVRDTGKNRAYWLEARKYDKLEVREVSRFVSELNDAICPFL